MLGANFLAFLIAGAVLVATVFSPTEVLGAKNKLHLKKPSKPLLKLPKEISQSGPKKSAVQNSFSQRLFDHGIRSQVIRNVTIHTAFIRGMALGTLNANYYGPYMVEDLHYLHVAANAFNFAAEFMRKQGLHNFEQFYRNESSVWRSDYLEPLLRAWHLENTKNVRPGRFASEYISFLHKVSTSPRHAKYLAIGLLPCTMLWRWMADELFPSVKVDSAYYSWFQENKSKSPGYRGSLERFVDENFSSEGKYQNAKPYFCQAMVAELNFFSGGANENGYTLPTECQVTG